MPILQKGLRFRLVGWLGAVIVRLLHATWHVTVIDPTDAGSGVRDGSKSAIVAFWHQHILTMLAHYRGYRVCVPVSEHRDGEYAAHVMDRFGLPSVRGSTTRGSLKLIRGLLDRAKEGYTLAITPDGPRGPKYSVQPGVTLLARRSNLPVHPVGIVVKSAWVLGSWDEFVVPKPWTRIVIVVGPALRAQRHSEARAFSETLRKALFAATEAAKQALGEMR